ncbi:hypothetical protein [Microbacterium arborescens]|uniref:hypothetical protein n=1 Tax=Microbacterium arborescens TaxID=33883 RepID=UPI0027D7FBAE|nr:hypothetical protein [Microbacterium arborescens]
MKFVLQMTSSCGYVGVFFSPAPMIVACGEPSGLETVVGWGITILTVSCLAAVPLLAGAAAAAAATAPQRRDSATLAVGVGIVTLAIGGALILDAQGTWGTNAWVFFSSVFGMTAYVASLAFSAVVRNAAARRISTAALRRQ